MNKECRPDGAQTCADSAVTALLVALVGHHEAIGPGCPLPDDFGRMLALMPRADLERGICLLAERFVMAVAATREHVELLAETEFGMHPHAVEKLNLPTMAGSLMGATLPRVDESKCCTTCAFKQGSAANQSPSTTLDALSCLDADGRPFMCHEDLDADGAPAKACRGYAQAPKLKCD